MSQVRSTRHVITKARECQRIFPFLVYTQRATRKIRVYNNHRTKIPFSAIRYQSLAIRHRLSAIRHRLSAICHQLSAMNPPTTPTAAPFDRAADVLHFEPNPLDSIFAPKNVAVIGASETQGSVGRTIVWNLISSPFGG